jgi:hypothetical protein
MIYVFLYTTRREIWAGPLFEVSVSHGSKEETMDCGFREPLSLSATSLT